MLLHTEVPGSPWRAAVGHPSLERYALHVGPEGCLVVGELGTVLTSPDGTRWTVHRADTMPSLLGCARGADGVVVAVDAEGCVHSSSDLRTWRREWLPARSATGAVLALRDGSFLLASGADAIYRGTPGRWELLETPNTEPVRAWWRAPSGELLGVGDGGTFLASTDEGRTFRARRAKTTRDLRCVHGDASGTLLLGGSKGLLLASVDAGKTWARGAAGADDLGAVLVFDGAWWAFPSHERELRAPLRSTDGGQTWLPAAELPRDQGYRACVASLRGEAPSAWLLPRRQGFLFERPPGAAPQDRSHGGGLGTLGVWTREDGAVVAFGEAGGFARSVDGGQSFTLEALPSVACAADRDLRLLVAVSAQGSVALSRDLGVRWQREELPAPLKGRATAYSPLVVTPEGRVLFAQGSVLFVREPEGAWRSYELPFAHCTAVAQDRAGTLYAHGGARPLVTDDQQVWALAAGQSAFAPAALGGEQATFLCSLPSDALLLCWRGGQRHRWDASAATWRPMPVHVHPRNGPLHRVLPLSDLEWVVLTYEDAVPWTRDGGQTWTLSPRSSLRAHWSCALPQLHALRRLGPHELVGAFGKDTDRLFR